MCTVIVMWNCLIYTWTPRVGKGGLRSWSSPQIDTVLNGVLQKDWNILITCSTKIGQLCLFYMLIIKITFCYGWNIPIWDTIKLKLPIQPATFLPIAKVQLHLIRSVTFDKVYVIQSPFNNHKCYFRAILIASCTFVHHKLKVLFAE